MLLGDGSQVREVGQPLLMCSLNHLEHLKIQIHRFHHRHSESECLVFLSQGLISTGDPLCRVHTQPSGNRAGEEELENQRMFRTVNNQRLLKRVSICSHL